MDSIRSLLLRILRTVFLLAVLWSPVICSYFLSGCGRLTMETPSVTLPSGSTATNPPGPITTPPSSGSPPAKIGGS